MGYFIEKTAKEIEYRKNGQENIEGALDDLYTKSSSGVINTKSINSLFSDIDYPAISNSFAVGNTIEVSNETELLNAISGANNYDTIKLISDITLTNTLIINKSLKFDGNFILQSAGNTTDPVILISVTANNVYFTENITIKHKKTSNTSIETAINVNASNFISYANVEFMEFGYILRGSFNIQGNISYTGVASNSNRAIAIYKISAPSQINNVVWDFVNNATPVSNFIFLSYAVSGDVLDYNLKVSNCFQKDIIKRGRQFILFEILTKTIGATPSLIVENNRFNCLNGDIGFVFSSTQDISFFEYIALFNNWSGSAGYDAGSYKGLCFCDGSGTLRSLGNTKIYTSGNINYPIIRSLNDYTSAIGKSVVNFKNTTFLNDVPLTREKNIQVENSQYNWIKNIDDCLVEVITDSTLTGISVACKAARTAAAIDSADGQDPPTAVVENAALVVRSTRTPVSTIDTRRLPLIWNGPEPVKRSA